MATGAKLKLYNGALRHLGQAKLASGEESENSRTLDEIYDDDAIGFALEQGAWNFATRTIESNFDSAVSDPGFGFSRAFSKPSDWRRTVKLATDQYFRNPMTDLQFNDERGFWWADIDIIYVSYISDDSTYGSDLSLWPMTFTKYFEAHLAEEAAAHLFQSDDDVKKIVAIAARALIDARSKDALNEGAKFHPPGGWATARRGGSARRDRGNRNSLIG